ncbi:uncharacterized protein LOC133200311 [Saccostrea echinata]|uniref:uncharacterized protein LOC133200311 n=1 Tax=Saccostrea echinata TaxID=191078 RepID=UPI002A7EB2A6|nr:uncharacterized protein LOC133200311 [Saccostrea echinata]
MRGLEQPVKQFARYKINTPLEEMEKDEVNSAFRKRTGESEKECMQMAGKEMTEQNLKTLLHLVILRANEFGQPAGQELSTENKDSEPEEPPAKKVKPTPSVEKRLQELEKSQKNEDKEIENVKEKEFNIYVPDCEKSDEFNPEEIVLRKREHPTWTTLREYGSKPTIHADGQVENNEVDLPAIDERLSQLEKNEDNKKATKKMKSLEKRMRLFLPQLPHSPDLTSMTPHDVCRFMVWSDRLKTQVHEISCRHLGKLGLFECACPTRLAAGTIHNMMQQISEILYIHGGTRSWDVHTKSGNPCLSPEVENYVKLCKEEQAKSHVLSKQAKPIFLGKIKKLTLFIEREFAHRDLSLREKFVLIRDQAIFKIQYFAGDRISDVCNILSQEVKKLQDNSSFVFNHTYGKTLRGDGKSDTFVVKRSQDKSICPVVGLENYYAWSKQNKVDLSLGYLFRPVSGRVLDQQLGCSAINERLRYYLVSLGIYEGETPHSLRGGFVVTMAISGTAASPKDVGWSSERWAYYYSRTKTLTDSSTLASNIANLSADTDEIEGFYRTHGDFSSLNPAFNPTN